MGLIKSNNSNNHLRGLIVDYDLVGFEPGIIQYVTISDTAFTDSGEMLTSSMPIIDDGWLSTPLSAMVRLAMVDHNQ